jgi:hypothetical protein
MLTLALERDRRRNQTGSFLASPKRLMRNIELKARLVDLDTARKVAAVIATKRLGPQHQIDTYFHCPHGRLAGQLLRRHGIMRKCC